MLRTPYHNALSVLSKASTPFGFLASEKPQDNYARIWTRDGVICGLAALASGEHELIQTFENTLVTIFKNQHPTGYFPSNCSPQTNEVSYGGAVGRADNPSWAIIGLCSYVTYKPTSALKTSLLPQVQKAFWVMDAWEYNGKNLMYVPLSGDWADEHYQHGYILFNQLLRIWALELASKVYQNFSWEKKAQSIRKTIEENFHQLSLSDKPYWPLLSREKEKLPSKYYILGFNPGSVYTQFDLQANALALYLEIGSKKIQENLLNYLHNWVQTERELLPSFFPAILENQPEMHVLNNNYAYHFRNKPYEFHNGGLWPVWNGFLLAAIKKYAANEMSQTLLSLLEKHTENNFNECYNGETQQACGVPFCTWSAAGIILATKGFYEN